MPTQPAIPISAVTLVPGLSGLLARFGAWRDARAGKGGFGETALVAFAIRVLSAAIAYLTQVILARWMGSAEYGIFVWVWVWVLILGGLSSLGLQLSVIRFVPQYLALQQFDLLAGVLRAGRAIPVAVASLVAALAILGLWQFGTDIASNYRWALGIAMLCLPFYALTDVQDGIGRGRAWIGLGLLPPYVLRPLLILAAMVASRAAGLPMLATTAAGAALFATSLTGLVQWGCLERRLGIDVGPAAPRFALKEWLATSLPICFVSACELVLQNLDVLVLTRFAQPAEVGIYFAALKSIGLIAFVNYAVGSALSGRLSELKARGNHDGVRQAIQNGAIWTFLPSLFGAIALLAIGKPLLSLFGAEFTTGYTLMVILAIGLVVRSAVGPAEWALRMIGEQKLCALVLFVSAVADVALSLALVPPFGVLGAALANAGAMTLSAALFYTLARRRLGYDVSAFARLTGSGRAANH
jgi:O-antigen/teichoic acid export membrane protein